MDFYTPRMTVSKTFDREGGLGHHLQERKINLNNSHTFCGGICNKAVIPRTFNSRYMQQSIDIFKEALQQSIDAFTSVCATEH